MFLLSCALIGVTLLGGFSSQASAHPAPQPVIAQVYGGGGNVSAPYQNDFIELFNRSGSTLDLSGYSVQYAAATSATWTVTPLSGTLAIGQHLLVAEGNSGGTAGAALPAPDAVGNTDLNLTSGKVALVSSFVPVSTACPSGAPVLDLVGYGSGVNCFEGSGPTPNTSNVLGVIRKGAGCTNTNDNRADFQALTPAPRNSTSVRNPCATIPAAPSVTGTAPTSPGNSTSPKVVGTAAAGTTVELYTNAACSGAAAATGTAAQFAAPGIAAAVAAESTTTFYALAFDANNTSSCSTSSVTYVEDSGVPTPPTLQASNPASPSNNTAPKILGAAETGSTVRIYTDAACTTLAATGTAAQFVSPGIATPVTPDTVTTFHATATDAAGNVSPCSTSSLTYVEDSTPPPPPTLTSSAPGSPSNSTSPRILGSAEAGSTVRLYADGACANLAATGTAAQFAEPGIAVSVPANSTTTFHATATDAVGNTSPCSTSTLTYVEDAIAPPAPAITSSSPGSPSNDASPKLVGNAEAGTTVRLYTDAGCTNLAATGSAAQFAAPGIAVSVPLNSTTSFHATATDAAGNPSGCSAGSLTYVEDSAPPSQPTFSSSAPSSPANSPTPRILGASEVGSTVRIYNDAACTNLLATGSAAEFAGPGISVTVPADSTTTFHATATDASGNASACSSSSLTYVEDSTPPPPPTLTSSSPGSPSNSTSPKILGNAEAGSTVRLYTDAACTNLAATGTAAQFSSPGIAVTVPPDSTTNFYATATDAVGNTSSCSTSSLAYVEDSTPPPAPTLTSSAPGSPANDTTPSILGTAQAGSTVRLFSDAACTNLVATGSAAQFAATGITVSVAANSTTTFRATATDAVGNVSGCSAGSLTYVEDSSAPPQPTFDSSAPTSPAKDTTPSLLGTAEAGSTVRIYTDTNCTNLAATGSSAEFGGAGIAVTVPANSTTTFHATATDAAGNVSACSSSSLTYVEDSTSPPAPTLTSSSPASPSNSTSPRLLGNAEAGSTVRIYTDAACTNLIATGSAAELGGAGIAVTVPANSTTTFHATATDSVGNVSGCSPSFVTYVEDSAAPPLPVFDSSAPASPAKDTAPRLLGSAEAGSTVRLYPDAACTNLVATGSAAEFGGAGIAVTVAPNSSTTFHATATDAAGNASACSSSSLTYVEDSAAPPQPVFGSSVPASPANDTSPNLLGTAEAGSTVSIYTDAACTNLVATGSAAEFGGVGIAVTVPANSTTTFHATATDAVGNASACSSSSLTYVDDASAPNPPTFSSSAPASPANDTTPRLLGSAEAGTTVRIYSDAACTDLLATGTAAEFAAPGIAVTVAADSTTSFHATARNGVSSTSACSPTSLTYVEDSTPPPAPKLTASDPPSPSSERVLRIRGEAEPGSIVRLYRDGACTDLAATGSAEEITSPGITVVVPVDSTTPFHATATDAAGNVSACSASSLIYTQEPASPPAVPKSAPTSPARQPKSPTVVISDLRITPRNFLGGNRSTPVAAIATASDQSGSTIRLRLSRGATVTFTVLREHRRRQKPGRLASPAHKLQRRLTEGANSVPFSGRLGNRIFPPGRYRLYAVATDSDGNQSNRASVAFRILSG